MNLDLDQAPPRKSRPPYGGAIIVALIGMLMYTAVGIFLTLPIHALYKGDPSVVFAPSHYYDARQYVFICTYGYNVPAGTLPTIEVSRMNWMPFYALLQCGLSRLGGVSLIYTGTVVSTLAVGFSLFWGGLTLANLKVREPALHAGALLLPPVGAAWLYLPGAEATYLAVGMAVMYLITLPDPPDSPRGRWLELIRAGLGALVGFGLLLTKPNALALIIPLIFAFFYRSWQRSQAAGYGEGLWAFVADVGIEHLPFRPLLRGRLSASLFAPRPIRYSWTPILTAAGIVLGFAYWLAYTSLQSGVPNYFLQQQLNVWGRAWYPGNLGDLLIYFGQIFTGDLSSPWRYNPAWNLAANLSALIPAASPRVPPLIRGMLPLMLLLLLYSGAVHGSDRYILSTALVAVGWGCWIAPQGENERWAAVRWGVLFLLAVFSSYVLVGLMFPVGEPQAWGIVSR